MFYCARDNAFPREMFAVRLAVSIIGSLVGNTLPDRVADPGNLFGSWSGHSDKFGFVFKEKNPYLFRIRIYFQGSDPDPVFLVSRIRICFFFLSRGSSPDLGQLHPDPKPCFQGSTFLYIFVWLFASLFLFGTFISSSVVLICPGCGRCKSQNARSCSTYCMSRK